MNKTVMTVLIALAGLATAHAQGPLTPPGAPAPGMKTLQELWDNQQAQQAQINAALQQNAVALNFLGAQLPWQITTVDSAGTVGQHTSLAFGPDGQPAISYFDNANFDLKFARFNGATWSTQTVDSAGSVGYYTSLVFGPDGQPAISYYILFSGDLKFARYNGSSWSVQTVDSGGDVGWDTSMAFGPDGQPAISYYDITNGDLKFARRGVFPPAP